MVAANPLSSSCLRVGHRSCRNVGAEGSIFKRTPHSGLQKWCAYSPPGWEKHPIWPSVWRSSLRTGKRLELDRTGPEKNRTAVSVFDIQKSKTTKRLVFLDWFRPVQTSPLYPLITPSNVAKGHVNWLKTDWDISNFVKSLSKLIWFIFISLSILAQFGCSCATFEAYINPKPITISKMWQKLVLDQLRPGPV